MSEQPEYEVMRISDLRISRRGKHHALISGILQQLQDLHDDSALIIPLNSLGEMSVADLRSAVARETRARKIPIKTYSDENNFYLWKKPEAPSKRKKKA